MIDGINGTWFAALRVQDPEKRNGPCWYQEPLPQSEPPTGMAVALESIVEASANRCKAFGADTLTDNTAPIPYVYARRMRRCAWGMADFLP